MSLLSPKRLCIGLAPDRVELARVHSGLRGAVVGEAQARVCVPEAGAKPWTAALATLEQLLGEPTAKAGEARVTLSNHFVRYLVLPWDSALLGTDELHAAATQHFERVFGDTAVEWELRVSPGEFGEPVLACAIDRALLQALDACIGRAPGGRLRLTAVEPLLMTAFNHLRARIGGDAVLAVFETNCLALAVLREGRWQRVVSRHAGQAPRARLIEQELALATADGLPGQVELLDFADPPWAADAALPLRRHPLPESDCRLALLGNC